MPPTKPAATTVWVHILKPHVPTAVPDGIPLVWEFEDRVGKLPEACCFYRLASDPPGSVRATHAPVRVRFRVLQNPQA